MNEIAEPKAQLATVTVTVTVTVTPQNLDDMYTEFNNLNVNGDEKVTLEDYKKDLGEFMHEEWIIDLFNDLDSNKDGDISFSEYAFSRMKYTP